MLDPVWSGMYPLQSWQCADLYSDMIHIDHSPCHYRYGAASLWPVATVAGAKVHYICMKKNCYEYEGNGGPQSKELTDTHLLYQQHPLSGPREQISGWGFILMTCSRCSRCWIELYMYEEDLLWVWREWGASIKRTIRYPPPIPTASTLSLRSQRASIRLGFHP